MSKKAAVYVRVSTDEQNFKNQIPALQQIADARGLVISRVYAETISGQKKSRPQLDLMKAAASRGEFQVLLVWAVDRLGRTMTGVVDTIVGLDELNVSIISHQESWLDTSGSTRPLLISIFAWVAEQERLRLIARTKEGLATARARGKTLGRPRVVVDMDLALRLRKEGLSVIDAAKRMGIGTGTLHKALLSADVPASARMPANLVASPTGPRLRTRVAK